MASDDQAKKIAYYELAPKLALMRYYNEKLDKQFNKAPFNKCNYFYKIVCFAQMYNKAFIANEPQCKVFNSHELQAFFNGPNMWAINDQTAKDYAGKFPKFVTLLVSTPKDLEGKFVEKTLSPTKDLPAEKIRKATFQLVTSIPDDLLRNQLLQKGEDITNNILNIHE